MDESELHIIYKHFRPIEDNEVKVPFHYRRGNTSWKPALRGGRTQCFIYDDEHRLIALGETTRHPNESFCYAEGRGWARQFAFEKFAVKRAKEKLREVQGD